MECKECGCHAEAPNPSVHQTLDELDFERGIWNAAVNGDFARVEQQLSKDVHPDAQDNSGFTSLHYAARNGHEKICSLLLQKGANPNVKTRAGGVTPLHRAAFCGHVEIVKLLLQHGAKVSTCDEDLKTALHKAAERGHTNVVSMLLEAKDAANIKDVVDIRGKKARDYAVDPHLIKVLT